MDWLSKYASIAEAERIRRIGALIATAVGRNLASCRGRSFRPERKNDPATSLRSQHPNDEIERRMIAYLSRVEVATPQDFRVALGLSAMTVTRRLAKLRTQGLLAVEGKTRSARYRLNARIGAN